MRRLSLPSDKDYALLCTNQEGEQKLAAWTLGEPHPATVKVRLKRKTRPVAAGGKAERLAPKYESGHLVLDLAAPPQYVTLGKTVINQGGLVIASFRAGRSR